MPEMRLQGKVALLAGAGPGMGRATALLFAQHGARVSIVARTETTGIETAQRIGAAGGTAMALSADLADGDAAQQAVQQVIAAYGRLDILYFGAGGFFTAAREYAEVDLEFWHLALRNTLDGLYHITQAARPHLRGGGAIVTVAASFSVRQATPAVAKAACIAAAICAWLCAAKAARLGPAPESTTAAAPACSAACSAAS